MNAEALRTEYELALDAALESDSQVRDLPRLLMAAQGDNPTMTAIDVARITATTLSINERLHEQAERHRKALQRIRSEAETKAMLARTGVSC
jgi:hypothetical protein